jgi:hypothetical protein
MLTPGGAPKISAGGRLEFRLADEEFGPVELHVTLRDNGGTNFGGRDYSETRVLLLVVEAVNDAPFFMYDVQNFRFLENTASEGVTIPFSDFRPGIHSGPSNEMCPSPGPNSLAQKMHFRVVDIDNPLLFSFFPNTTPDSNYFPSL